MGTAVWVGNGVCVGIAVLVGCCVAVGNGVFVPGGVTVNVFVGNGVFVGGGVSVGSGVSVLVGVSVGSGVSVDVGVTVGVSVTVGVLVGVRVGRIPICSPVQRTELMMKPIRKITPTPYITVRRQPDLQLLSLPFFFAPVLRAPLLIIHLCPLLQPTGNHDATTGATALPTTTIDLRFSLVCALYYRFHARFKHQFYILIDRTFELLYHADASQNS